MPENSCGAGCAAEGSGVEPAVPGKLESRVVLFSGNTPAPLADEHSAGCAMPQDVADREAYGSCQGRTTGSTDIHCRVKANTQLENDCRRVLDGRSQLQLVVPPAAPGGNKEEHTAIHAERFTSCTSTKPVNTLDTRRASNPPEVCLSQQALTSPLHASNTRLVPAAAASQLPAPGHPEPTLDNDQDGTGDLAGIHAPAKAIALSRDEGIRRAQEVAAAARAQCDVLRLPHASSEDPAFQTTYWQV